VRDPRPGLAWSAHRTAVRAGYGGYMGSPEWFRRREWWLEEYRAARSGQEPVCAACGAPWTLRDGDLHHRSYARLGEEGWRDLTPLCRACHDAVHVLLESSPSWRRLPRDQATDLIVAKLTRRNR
jgi:5-methylcytosine-specific restriction endonuclease McrA